MSKVSALPSEWQNWLNENIERGCSQESLAEILRQNGFKFQFETQTLEPTQPPKSTPRLALNSVQANNHPVRISMQLDSPLILLFDNLLTAEECDMFVASADAKLQRSTVVDQVTGESILHEHRTSAGCCFQRNETPLVATIEQRIESLLEIPIENGEGLQILRYENGGEYRPHFDYFDPNLASSAKHLAHGGQRVGTVVLYLSDVLEGGATRFPTLGLEVRPQKGSAVFFANIDVNNQVDPRTLHAGQPVVNGVKYIATKWLRESEYL